MNLVLDHTIRVPLDATDDLAAFRQWTKSDTYPDRGDYAYLNGDLWVDLSMETLLHNQIKMQIAAVLSLMVVDPGRLGRFFADRTRLVTVEAGLSCEPDAMFASRDSIQSGLATWEEGAQSLEVIGVPDMVLEVVNTHSVQKDTVVLRDLYAAAGIAEYWLVNPLGGQLSFEILRLTAKGYTPTRQTGGWIKSTVFGKSFRLVEEKAGDDDLPTYRLLVR